MDLIDLLRPTANWNIFSAYVRGLPPYSKTLSAMAMNPDVAKAQIDSLSDEQIDQICDARRNPDDKKEESLLPEGYDYTAEMLTQIADEISLLRHQVVSMVSQNKPKKFTPRPRPETAYVKALNERIEKHEQAGIDELRSMIGF